MFCYDYFKSHPISRQISNCFISDTQSMLVQSDIDFEKLGSAVTGLRKVPFELTGIRHRGKTGLEHIYVGSADSGDQFYSLMNLNLMCKTATVVTESTVSMVSDLQKTMFRNVTAVVVAVFPSELVSPSLTKLTMSS